MEYEKIAKKNRKRAVLDADAPSYVKVSYGLEDVKKLVPHREPFLLVDRIDGIDLEQRGIVGGIISA